MTKAKTKKTAQQFDEAFDEGRDVTESLDLSSARRVNYESRRVNVDFPAWMVQKLDREAARLGIPRQSLIKTIIARHCDGSER